MAKNKISEFSSNPANNTDIAGIDIAEGCAPSGINNAIRELMAQLKDMITGADGDSQVVGGNLTVDGTTTLTGAVTAPAGIAANVTGNVNGNVNGNVTGDVTGNVIASSGSAAAPSITRSGDTNTGIFFPAADTMAFTKGGEEVMRINSLGNIGIGNTAPNAKLDVSGNGTFRGNGADAFLSLLTTFTSGFLAYRGNTSVLEIVNALNGPVLIATDGTSRLVVTGDGQLRTKVTGASSTLMDAFTCRAWVNFNGTGTVAIRGSGNVSSVTDNGTGNYTVNLTTAMPDANYAPSMTFSVDGTFGGSVTANEFQANVYAQTASNFSIATYNLNPSASSVGVDFGFITASIVR